MLFYSPSNTPNTAASLDSTIKPVCCSFSFMRSRAGSLHISYAVVHLVLCDREPDHYNYLIRCFTYSFNSRMIVIGNINLNLLFIFTFAYTWLCQILSPFNSDDLFMSRFSFFVSLFCF